ncbi:hypothetical protein NU688_13400 [Variovorax sp. ZS18.2.2]|uniref:TRAP transporter substrate-binding protein n=1 Tax=Variovorax sp. ZS18.2.2 TaxID=2971255 RepID=UPI002150BC4B|nr:hypothetical protein [Variovorax sp. ZS18.2.2]MCR6477151.1 hypothetical protein [Variovorax sp. ZS18.2.2]
MAHDTQRFTRRTLMVTAGALGTAAAPSLAQGTDRIVWRLATVTPLGFPLVGDAVQDFARTVGAMSNGRLGFEIDDPSKNGGPAGLMKLVREGRYDAAHATAHYYAGDIPAIDYFTAVPFGLTAVENHGWMNEGGGAALFEAILEPLGVVPMICGNTNVQMGGWYAHEIKSVNDFRNLRIRMAGLPARVLGRFGAKSLEVGFGQITAAFQNGTINAADIIGPWVDQPLGVGKYAPFYYGPWHEPDVSMHLFVNKQRFEALPPDLQQIVRQASAAVSMRSIAKAQYRNAMALAELERAGTVVRTFPPAVTKALQRVTAELLEEDARRDEMSARVIASFKAYLAAVKRYARVTDAVAVLQR